MPPGRGPISPARTSVLLSLLTWAAVTFPEVMGQETIACPPSTVYCGNLQRCVSEEICSAQDPATNCGSMEMYCVSQQRCVGVGQRCDDQQPQPDVRCPADLLFCLTLGTCVLPGSCPHTEDWSTCGPGTVFCMATGSCQPAGQGCGRPTRAVTCPLGTAYCMAQGRCVPTSCEHQAPVMPRPLDQCQNDEIFCAFTGQCQPAAKSCGFICPPSHVVCAGQDRCVSYRDCNNRNGTGLTWTLPVPVVQGSEDPPPAVTLSSLLRSPAIETLLQAQVVPSLTVDAADPGWGTLDTADGQFQPVEAGSRLLLDQLIQYRPSGHTGFGLRRINLVQNADTETTLQYSVVQYVLPSVQLVALNASRLTISEDEAGTLLLSDLITMFDAGEADLLEELGGQLQSPELDRSAVGYQQLRSLFQPTVPVRISYAERMERRSQVPGEVFFSYTEGDDSWTQQALEQEALVLELPRNATSNAQPRVMFMPKPNYQGTVRFTVQVSLGGTTTESQLTLTVAETNDAPMRSGPAPEPLLLPLGSQSVAFTVADLVGGTFTDPDGASTGAAAVLAAGPPLGSWQWAPAGGEDWRPLESLASALVPAQPDCGPLPADGLLVDLTLRLTGAEACRSAAEGETEPPPVVVTPQYLAPEDRLRFTAENLTRVWSQTEAQTNARLLLAAWDQTARPQNITLPRCQPNCGGSSSLSSSLLEVTVLRSDCTGLPVYSAEYASVLDQCAVCGGTGDSCVDCNNDVNGTAYTDCQRCVGGDTGLDPERDCAHQCMLNHVVTIAGNEMCVEQAPARVPPCDNAPGSGAYYNLCGHCVLGGTGLPATYGQDSCGRCAADPSAADSQPACLLEACDGAAASPRRRDRCGNCRDPASPQWSACRRFGSPPAVVDVTENTPGVPTVILPIRNQTEPWDPTLISCYVQDATGAKTQVSTFPHGTLVTRHGVSRESFSVGANLVDLPLGTYDFGCGDDVSAASFSLVNGTALQIATMEPPDARLHGENKVEVTLVTQPVEGAPVLLGLVAPEPVRPRLTVVALKRARPSGKVAAGSLTSLLPRLPSAGVYRAVVGYNSAALVALLRAGCDTSCQASAKTLRVVSDAPRMTGASFTPPYRHIAIDFDVPVWTEQECAQLLDSATLQALGDPECGVRGSQLLVRLGDKMAAPSGSSLELTLAADSAISRLGSGGGELASRASGSVTVNLTQALAEPPQFSLTGPAVVCAGEGARAAFRALTLASVGRPLSFSWNITLESEAALPQATTLTVWSGINDVIARGQTEQTSDASTYTIDTSRLVGGNFSYQVFVKATQDWTSSSRILSRSFDVTDAGMSVTIAGPDRIARGALYTYHATAASCGSEETAAQTERLTYSWRLPGVPTSHLDGLDSRTLHLDTSQLTWQSEYRLTCVVTMPDSGAVYTATLRLQLVGAGVRARLPAEQRAVSPGQVILVDGSRSEDLDGRPGQLSYTWSCRLASSGAGCFVGQPPQPLRRLESQLGQQQLSQPVLRVPAGLLAAGQHYRLTLRVEKEGDVDTASTDVYVNPEAAPKLWIDRRQDTYDPHQSIYIPAQVSTDWPVTVMWTTDYRLPPEVLDSAPFRPTRIPAGARRRPFDLVLPALERAGGERGCVLCGKVIPFVLRVALPESDSQSFSAAVDVSLQEGPLLGNLKVTAGDDAMMTSLDATAGWTAPSAALPLSYEFGYVDTNGSRVAMRSVSNDVPRVDVLLPRDAVRVYVQVCSAVCLTVDSGVSPSQNVVKDDQGIRRLGELLVDVSQSARPEEVLAWSAAVLDRLTAGNSSAAAADLGAIVHYVAKRALSDLTSGLAKVVDSGTAKQRSRAVDQAVAALSLLQPLSAALPQPDISSLRSSLHELLLPPPPVPQYAGLVRRARRSPRRHRRAVSDAGSTTVSPLDAVQALRLLLSAEQSAAGPLLSTAGSLLVSLCAGLPSTNSRPVAVLGDRLQLQAARRRLDGAASAAWWPFVQGSAAANGSQLGASTAWRSWQYQCSTDPETEQAVMCSDMCVTTWVTEESLLTASADRLQADLPPRRTAVYNVGLLQPTSFQPQFTERRLSAPFTVRMALNSSVTLPEGRTLECRSWQEETWSSVDCDTGSATVSFVSCLCRRPGAVAAFEVESPEPSTTPPPTTTEPPTIEVTEPRNITNITLRIDADFSSVVGTTDEDKEAFVNHVRPQVAASMSIDESKILSMSVRPGSIMLDMSVDTTASSFLKQGEPQDPLEVLAQLVQNGQLELTDLQGNRLVIPRDGLDDVRKDPVKEEENTRTAVIIGVVIAVIVVLCIIAVIVAVVVKNKKRSKVGSTTSPTDRSQQNTYKSFQFEHVMDGTAASLEKYKSSHGMEDSDRYLAETMRAHSARRASVPRPARYDTPSQEQMDATQPIPESLQEESAQ